MDMYVNAGKIRERVGTSKIKTGMSVQETPFLLDSYKHGKAFGSAILSDSDGKIKALIDPKADISALVGKVVTVTGIGWIAPSDSEKTVLKVREIREARDFNVMDVFSGLSPEKIEEHWSVLLEYRTYLSGSRGIGYGMLLDAALFKNEEAKKAFIDRPATLTLQANYRGGLLQETATILRMAVSAANSYKKSQGLYMVEPDWQLLIVSAILHGYGNIFYYTPYPSVKTQEGVINGYSALLKMKLKEIVIKHDIPISDKELGLIFSTMAFCCENADRSAKPSTKEGRFLGHIYEAFVDNDLDNQAITGHTPCPADASGYIYDGRTGNYILLSDEKVEAAKAAMEDNNGNNTERTA